MKEYLFARVKYAVVCVCVSFSAICQMGQSFDPDIIEKFHHLSDEKVSRDSKWMAWKVAPVEGDGFMILLNNDRRDTLTLQRCVQLHFNHSSDYALGIVSPPFEEVRNAKRAKKPKDKWPKNILIRISASFQIDTVGEVERLYFPEKATEVAYFTAPSRPNPIHKDSTEADTAASKPSKITSLKEKPLYRLNIKTGDTLFLAYPTDVAVSADGMWVLYTTKNPETASGKKILALFKSPEATHQVLDTLSFDFKKLLVSDFGTYVSWLSVSDSVSDPPIWKWTVAQNTGGKRIKIQFADTLVLEKYINADGDWMFSESESRLYLTLLPDRPPKQKPDSTKLEEERPEFDLYTHADYHLMTWQLANLGQLRSKGLKAVYHTGKNKLVMITSDIEEYAYIDTKKDDPYLLVRLDEGLKEGRNWEFPNEFSYQLVHTDDGRRLPVVRKVRSGAVLSPGGQFVTWFDPEERVWKCFRVRDQSVVALGADVATEWHQASHDLPSPPPPFGLAGFTAGDRRVWIYDRHHIYACDPNGRAKSVKVSHFSDQDHEVRYRGIYQRENFIGQVSGSALLVQKNLHSLEEKLVLVSLRKGNVLNSRALNKSLLRILGGEFGQWFLLREESYLQYPEVQTVSSDLRRSDRWSGLGMQYEGFRRGQVFKFAYQVRLSNDSLVELEGLVYMDTVEAVKQPAIVYFYERNAENMHRHYSPRFSRSIINPLVYVSQGYAVIVPDIVYTVGNPGRDALLCVSAAVDTALKLFNRIDGSRLGLNGQSWGGYQVAYIITQTDRYKAAFAGAPVANMTSAYGGIRWGTGYSRISQYEQGQSRIGAPLWDDPQAYIQNSPLIHLPRVETPLLIMHNDRDGAVPYYQGIELFMGLNRLKKPVWMLVYNKEDHNLTQLKNMRDLTGKVLDFYNHFLKGEPMPEWMKGIPATRKGLDF